MLLDGWMTSPSIFSQTEDTVKKASPTTQLEIFEGHFLMGKRYQSLIVHITNLLQRKNL